MYYRTFTEARRRRDAGKTYNQAVDRQRRAQRSAFVEAVIDRLPLLTVDLPTARAHSRLWSELAADGRLIGAHDMWLAAAAIAHDLHLVTANMHEFSRVPALRLEDWSG